MSTSFRITQRPIRVILASLAVVVMLSLTATVPMASASGRGNQNKYQVNWWGLRIWLNHTNTQATERAVAASGYLNHAGSIPGVPFPANPALKYVGCAGQFVLNLRRDDVGYGVVFDAPWYTPFWTCGLKVWSQ
jgi:hypothetical protein